MEATQIITGSVYLARTFKVFYKRDCFPDFSDESTLPPPPTPAMFQVDNNTDSSQDDEDLPPPPPPSLPPPISSPNIPSKINYLTAVTPKPYKSPFSLSNSSTPVPPPPSFEGNQLRDSPISSVSLSLPRPRSFDLDSKDGNRGSLSSQIASFALTESNSDPALGKETRSLPWLQNNSQGTSPLERSSSSESENQGGDEEVSWNENETKKSNWSISEQHAEKRVLGSAGFSLRPSEDPVKKIVDSDNDSTGRVVKEDTGIETEKVAKVATNEKPQGVPVSPKVSIGGASSARSSKSIAKMILNSRKNSESNNQQGECNIKMKNDSDYANVVPVKKDQVTDNKEKIQSLYDAEDPSKLVPLTFRRSDADANDSDENTEIVARKENKSPDKNVTFSIVEESNNNNARSVALSKKTKEEDTKYHLVRAEPFVEGEQKGYKGPKSSKSIANMILNGKKEKPSNSSDIVQKKTNHILKPQLKSEFQYFLKVF